MTCDQEKAESMRILKDMCNLLTTDIESNVGIRMDRERPMHDLIFADLMVRIGNGGYIMTYSKDIGAFLRQPQHDRNVDLLKVSHALRSWPLGVIA